MKNEKLLGDQCIYKTEKESGDTCRLTKSYRQPQGMNADVASEIKNSANHFMHSTMLYNKKQDDLCFRQGEFKVKTYCLIKM